MLAPFLWMFSMSFRRPVDAFRMPPDFIPASLDISNYIELLKSIPVFTFFYNSIIISVTITLAQLITSTTAAFAFARLRFPGRGILFILILVGMMIPVQVTIIPLFIGMSKVGLTDSLLAIILPLLTYSFGIFLVRSFFMGLPIELEEAARIDGCGAWGIFFKIALPQAKGIIAALGIFSFVNSWNLYFQPLIFLNSRENFTIPLGISGLTNYMGAGNLAVIMAAVSLSVLPVFVVFLVAQRHIIEGITMTGIKG